jgi:hypothetical protein
VELGSEEGPPQPSRRAHFKPAFPHLIRRTSTAPASRSRPGTGG